MVPSNDPTLLFTNAGMVQFKDYFLGLAKPPFSKAVSSQKCLRVGGKHNDLDNVGHTARHQTFFEMLGNFSFGGYGKREAIQYAWNYLTKVIELPESRLAVSVLDGDEEAIDIWRKDINIPSHKIFKKGQEDNFWSMGGNDGPCGPCTEIFWDHEKEVDGDRYLEIWNLVFMQYHQTLVSEGKIELRPLPFICIDTGMGLERIASVVQGQPTNFDIDSMMPLRNAVRAEIDRARKNQLFVAKEADWIEIVTRVVADHARATALLISEGVMPDQTGRGYILRKLVRRAALYAYQAGIRGPILEKIYPALLVGLGATYPELIERSSHICSVLTLEETSFLNVFDKALKKFNEYVKLDYVSPEVFTETPAGKMLNASFVHTLYDTYGLPVDITSTLATERGLSIDFDGFQNLRKQQKINQKKWSGSGDSQIPPPILQWQNDPLQPKFTGYSSLNEMSKILKEHYDPKSSLLYLAVDPCPFYAESGGQVGDKGSISFKVGAQEITLPVEDTFRPYPNGIAIKLTIDDPTLRPYLSEGAQIHCRVDPAFREEVKQAHTATHLLHSALREVLGSHVVQSGSKVLPGLLRFDFSHPTPLTDDLIQKVEDWVNNVINNAQPVAVQEMSYQNAITSKAMGLFSERYPDEVRVVDVKDFSREICGGTHVQSTDSIIIFKIISESSVSLGKRRIEAVVGKRALQYLLDSNRNLQKVARKLNTNFDDLFSRLDYILKDRVDLKTQVNALRNQVTETAPASEKVLWSGQFENVNVIIYQMEHQDKNLLRKQLNTLQQKCPEAVVVLINKQEVLAIAKKDGIHCGRTIGALLAKLGGKGGGSATYAEGTLPKNTPWDLLTTQ
uniref:Alanine--tRNA ligase n=1 Tax=Arcella intermedia TaxID=1963864 RepID=A0A6B2KXI3_9EUKA